MEEPLRCAYILPKKKRSCRMLVKKGNVYCGEHALVDTQNTDRIPCPNDPKHSVAKSELESHLKRCNSRISDDPWIQENLNSIVEETRYDAKIDIRPTLDEIRSVNEKLEKAFASISDKIETVELENQLITGFLASSDEMGPQNRKHLRQLSSIIGHMTKSNLLIDKEDACVFELGAGKGQLAYWMAKQAPKGRFLLVDRSGSRNKYENKAIQDNPSLNMKRLRCSIEHLDLSKVDLLKGATSLSAVCKHFCGSATDAGIRCLANGIDRGLPLDGFVLVPCCHHKSRLVEYCGKDFLEKFDITSTNDFAALRHVASWAICGITARETSENASKKDPSEDIDAKRPKLDQGDFLEDEKLDWSASYKEEQGRKAKCILEFGRAEYLKTLGFDTNVVRYIDFSVSPENLLILGTKRV